MVYENKEKSVPDIRC